MSAKHWIFLVGLLLTACQSAPPAPAVPTPQVWNVAVSSSVTWLAPDFNQCMLSLPERAIHLAELPADRLLDNSPDVAIRWGAPAELQSLAYELGRDRMAVIVNAKNPVRRLNQINLQGIFNGSSATWAEVFPKDCPDCLNLPEGEIEAWVYPTGEDIQTIFEEIFPGATPLSSAAFLASSPADVMAAVAASPTAIGFVPAAWLEDPNPELAEIEVTGMPAGSLERPYLAITTNQPVEDLSAWLACLQQSISTHPGK